MASFRSLSLLDSISMQDPLLLVLSHLPVKDLLALSQSSKSMRELCAIKQLWVHIWNRDIISQNILSPAQVISLDLMNGAQLKAVVVHALRLHRYVTSPPQKPIALQRVLLPPQDQSVTWTRLVGGTWLLVAMSNSTSSVISLFSVRSLLGARNKDLVARAFLEGPVLNGLAQVSATHGIVIALELRTPKSTLEVLSIRSHNDALAFVRLARHDGVAHLRAMLGQTIAFSLHNELSLPSLIDWTTGSVVHLCPRPDPDGSAVAIALKDDKVVFLTPRKLTIMRQSVIAGNSRYTTLAVLAVTRQVGQAIVGFRRDGYLQVCILNEDGVYGYTLRVENDTDTPETLESCLVWSREPERGEFGCNFAFAMRPHFDENSDVVSWLETLENLSPTACPARLMTTIWPLPRAALPKPQDVPLFSFSEREMPALYALSVRDYDAGLGLLVIGNTIGELGLYSLGGGDLQDVQDVLQTVTITESCGQEPLPQSAFAPHPPRTWIVENASLASEASQQMHLELWAKCWPEGFEVPNNWRRASPFNGLMIHAFSDWVSGPSWELEYGCHFLGRPTPFMEEKKTNIVLFKAGGLFFLYIPNTEEGMPIFDVIDPNLTLHDIFSLVSENPSADTLREVAVNSVSSDLIPVMEIRNLYLFGRWEARHGMHRWKEFVERGGEEYDEWSESAVFEIGMADIFCANCRRSTWSCPCAALLNKYYPDPKVYDYRERRFRE